MTADEKDLIKCFASGVTSLRSEAIAIHRKEIARTEQARGTPEMDFMAEVDNVCPDLALRAGYRKQLLSSELQKARTQGVEL